MANPIQPDKKIAKYTDKEMDALLYCEPMKIKTKVRGGLVPRCG